MKNFQDYYDYLLDKIKTEPEAVPIFARISSMDRLSGENFSAFMEQYTKDITEFSSAMAMYYLRIYHEWLQE